MNEHYGNPEKILILACKTVGIDLNYVLKILKVRSGHRGSINSINVGDWCFVCSLLKLDAGCISYGYSRVTHVRRIGEALKLSEYHLPITFEVKTIYQAYKRELKEEDKNMSAYYGDELLEKIHNKYFMHNQSDWTVNEHENFL